MEKSFKARVLTPEQILFEGDVTGVQVPGMNGKFEMLFNHAPIISSLVEGSVRIRKTGSEDLLFSIDSGFLEMNNNQLTILAESAKDKRVI
ncbi:MAG: ATP synthase F1 subunit epsilon [Balneolaceae bacterium]